MNFDELIDELINEKVRVYDMNIKWHALIQALSPEELERLRITDLGSLCPNCCSNHIIHNVNNKSNPVLPSIEDEYSNKCKCEDCEHIGHWSEFCSEEVRGLLKRAEEAQDMIDALE